MEKRLTEKVAIVTGANRGIGRAVSVALAKEGATISEKLAAMLKRLDIKPMEIGLDLVAVWEAGFIFNAKDLAIDEEQFAADLTMAAQWAINLAVEVGFPTTETIPLMIQKAQRQAVAVSVESAFLTDATKEAILAKAEREAVAVQDAQK